MGAILREYGYRGFMIFGVFVIVALTICRRKQYGLSVLVSVLYILTHFTIGVLGAVILFAAKNGFASFQGMAFYGGIFLIMMTMPFLAHLFQLTPGQALDISAPALAAYSAVFRFGCLCAGCCGGIVCNIGNITFQWPTQIMEAVGDILLLAVLLYLSEKKEKEGLLYPLFLVHYGMIRFAIEWVRTMEPFFWGMTEGHWNSLLSILIGTVWLYCRRKKQTKTMH